MDSAGGARPVTSYRSAATVLNISEDTLCRRRRERGCQLAYPWWESPAAVVAWWKALIAPQQRAPRRGSRKERALRGTVYDDSALVGDDR